MKKMTAITLTAMMVLTALAMAVAAQEVDVRGAVHNIGETTATYDTASFAGFYYDIDKDIGKEQLIFTPTDVNVNKSIGTLSDQTTPRGVVYTTTAQDKKFKYKGWGQYKVIGFLADRYFASYNKDITPETEAYKATNQKTAIFADKSDNINLMTNEQISKVFIDDNTERTITSANPLQLQEGYQLAVKNIDIDGNKVYVELSKNGQVVDSKIIQPSITGADILDKTYYYKRDLGDTKKIVQIAAHFKNAFRGAETNIATIDGVFQISDTPSQIKADQQYDKMSIRKVDPATFTITMDNKDNAITLSKNKDTTLMTNIRIKTADQDASSTEPLRYYIYKAYTEPGTYEIRGSVSNVGQTTMKWDTTNFAGFYYDIDKDIGKEQLIFTPTDVNANKSIGTISDQTTPRGAVYTTKAQDKKFKYKGWGQYKVIGFLADRYFASYNKDITPETEAYKSTGQKTAIFADKSDNINLMTNEQISKVLVDDNTEKTFTSASPLQLQEGYQLAVKSVDTKGNKVYVELSKNGQVVDSKVIQPSIDGADILDKTYYYKRDLGETKKIVQIAAHFKNAFLGADTAIATIDGVFQISDTPTPIKADQQYDKMSIRKVDPALLTVEMDNKDNAITLSKNKDTVLMTNIHIRTADQDATNSDPLRYYIYKSATIAAAAPVTPAASANVTAPANATAPAKAETPATAAPAKNETPTKNETPAKNATPTTTPKPAPGFESIFAITGLMAVAYLVLGRKQ